jgi:hypothetical protein
MKKVLAGLSIFCVFVGVLFFSNSTEASVGTLMKLESSATKVKFNDPLTLTWDIQPTLLTGEMKCIDWNGEPITQAKGSKTISHIRHQTRFQMGCSMVVETATNAVATAHASNMIEIEIDTSEPVVLTETESFDESNIDDEIVLGLEMNNKKYVYGANGLVSGALPNVYKYIDTPVNIGKIFWKYDVNKFEYCSFSNTDLNQYVIDNAYEERLFKLNIPGSGQSIDQKRKALKSEGKVDFDISKQNTISFSCLGNMNVPNYKMYRGSLSYIFYNIEGGSDAPAETPSTDISKSSDPLKLTMKADDKIYKVSGSAFDYTYDTRNTALSKENMGVLNVFTKSKTATLEWQADSSVFKYCQRDGQEMNKWALGDVLLSGSQEINIGPGTNLYQITCTSGDKSSLYSGAGKMARVYISTNETSGLVIITDDAGNQIATDDEDDEESNVSNNDADNEEKCVSHLEAYNGDSPCCDGLTPYYKGKDESYTNGVCIDLDKLKSPATSNKCANSLEKMGSISKSMECCTGLIDYYQKDVGNVLGICLSNEDPTTAPIIDSTQSTWKDYSSMLEMPKVTVDSGMPVCTTIPDEKFHGCYYKGKIDDQINIPDQSLILGGETVMGNRIDHDWGTEKIISGLDGTSYTDSVSAIWKGKFYFGEGDYLFKATADDGVKVILDDNSNVIYKWYPQPRNTHISDLTHLTEGYHTVTVRYYEEGHKAAVKIWWEEQRPAIEAEALSAELSTFQKLIEQLRDLVTKVLNFFGIE